MTSEEYVQQATGLDTQNAQIIGLAAIIANLPGLSDVKAHAVDTAIEGACHELNSQVGDTATKFAHDILLAARTHFTPGVFSNQGHMVTVRGGHRGG